MPASIPAPQTTLAPPAVRACRGSGARAAPAGEALLLVRNEAGPDEKRQRGDAEQREPPGAADCGGEEQQRKRWKKDAYERHDVLTDRRRRVAASQPSSVTSGTEAAVQGVTGNRH